MAQSSIPIDIILAEGEGQTREFKESAQHLAREMVAFANASGGSLFIEINDQGQITGSDTGNRTLSQIQDQARNCDPAISIRIRKHPGAVLEIEVPEGSDKPYQCKDGFFLRMGPNAQKLKRDEIIALIATEGSIRFDEQWNPTFRFPQDFDDEKLKRFLKLSGLNLRADTSDILQSLEVACDDNKTLRLNNAGVLFFAKDPQKFFKESYLTCVRYQGVDRFNILDLKEIHGDLITQIDEAMQFVMRHSSTGLQIAQGTPRHQEIHDYPPSAIREALTNAVTHRDYAYDASHIYLHLFSNRLEIENPGGLFKGLSIEQLGKRSIRRNRCIADLFYRAGYIERVGSGIDRIRRELSENQNPPFEASSSNFFVIKFYPRVPINTHLSLSARQRKLLQLIKERGQATKQESAIWLGCGPDTALREIKLLIDLNVLRREGEGKQSSYVLA